MPLIDPQIAREWQAKSVIARKMNRELREQAPAPAPQQGATVAISCNPFITTRARKIEKLIDRLLAQLADCSDAKEQQAKSMALDRLFGAYAYMTGLERPGVSRGTKRRTVNPLSDLHESPPDQ